MAVRTIGFGSLVSVHVGMAVWWPQQNRDRWIQSSCGRHSPRLVFVGGGVVANMVFAGKVSSVLLVETLCMWVRSVVFSLIVSHSECGGCVHVEYERVIECYCSLYIVFTGPGCE